MRQLEHREQVVVTGWLRAAGILHCAIPNGARTSMAVAKRLKAEGMSSGAPDLLIFDAPPLAPEFVGVAIEMKRADGKGRLSKTQETWLIAMAARGWKTMCCAGAADAFERLAALGYQVPR